MSRAVFDRYWNSHYADAPSGQPGDDNAVPYEHLQKYSGKPVAYNFVDMSSGIAVGGKGTLGIQPALLSVRGDTGHLNLAANAIGTIKWQEKEKSYIMFEGKLSIQPL